MFLQHRTLKLLLAVTVQVMSVAASFADDGKQHEWKIDEWMDSHNCSENIQITELFKEFSAFSRDLISNFNTKEQQWRSEQMELSSKAASCISSLQQQSLTLTQLNLSHAQDDAEWQREKLDLNLKIQSNEQELTELRQKLQSQFVKYEELWEEIQISIIDKTSYDNIAAICKAIHNSKCAGVRCYDVKLAQDMKEHNYLTASGMYEDLITKLSPCLKLPNIHIQQLIDEKDNLRSKLKDLEKSLLGAARDGNVGLMRTLISSGANVNTTDKDGYSGLILACWYNQTAIAKLLIEAGTWLNTRNKNNSTALMVAAFNNQTEICRMLLTAGADFTICNKYGSVALTYAVSKNNLDLVKLLLELGAEVNVAANDGNTPIHTAARCGHVNIAKILVDHGANLNVTNDDGKSPLARASFYNQTEMVSYLISIGVKE